MPLRTAMPNTFGEAPDLATQLRIHDLEKDLAEAREHVRLQAELVDSLTRTSQEFQQIRNELADRAYLRDRLEKAEADARFWKAEAKQAARRNDQEGR